MSATLSERIKWVIVRNHGRQAEVIAEAVIREIESTHRIVDPDAVTESMLDACFGALPEHYDPPDPKKRLWHAFKAKRRFSSMVRAVSKHSR